MRVAYVCYWLHLERDGVAYKIDAQAREWRAAGHEVAVFCLTGAAGGRSRPDWNLYGFESPFGRFAATRQLVDAVRTWEPNGIYLRYDLFLPPLPSLVRSIPTVVEINGDERGEAELRGSWLAGAYSELNRRRILSASRALVCVTRELARHPAFIRYGTPAYVIGNGVALDSLHPLPPPPTHARAQIAFLGSPGKAWHGVDKIDRLARLLPEVDIHLIGCGASDLACEPPSNLFTHGVLSRVDYEPLLASCDLAIGTLALHRARLHEGSPLKVREYLGYGLPVVIGYEDTDLMGLDRWFVLELPNCEQNVELGADAVLAFANRVRGHRVPREDVERLIGSEIKERRRLEILLSAAGEAAAPNPVPAEALA